MAKYRHIHTTFWNDPLVLDLTPEQKYFYLYLLTNDKVKQCGIYEISLRQIVYQTGYNKDTILTLLAFFEDAEKIIYSANTNEILLRNFLKYNSSKSPKVIKCIEDELTEVKNPILLEHLRFDDTVSIDYTKGIDKKKKKKKKNKKEKEKEFIDSVFVFEKDFNKKMLNEFIEYWTESNSDSDNSQMRFEKCDIFNIKKRLARWNKNSKTFGSKKSNMPDFLDNVYLNRIKDDSYQTRKYYKHLVDNCGYIKKETLTGAIKYVKK